MKEKVVCDCCGNATLCQVRVYDYNTNQEVLIEDNAMQFYCTYCQDTDVRPVDKNEYVDNGKCGFGLHTDDIGEERFNVNKK